MENTSGCDGAMAWLRNTAKIRKPVTFAALSAAAFLLAASGGDAPSGIRVPGDKAPAFEKAAGNYLVASYFYRRNDMDVAFRHFDLIGDALPTETAKYRYLIASVLSGNMESALRLARSGGLGGNRVLPSLVEMASVIRNGQWERLQEILGRAASAPDGSSEGLISDYTMVPLIQSWYFGALGNYDQAVKQMGSEKSKRFFSEPFILLQKALMADVAQRKEEADALYMELAAQPHMPYYYVRLAGNYFERAERPDEALALYERYRKENDKPYRFRDAEIRMKEGKAPKEEVVGFAQGVGLVLLETARILSGHDMLSEAMLYARLAEYVAADIPEIYAVMAQYYSRNGTRDDMRLMYEKLAPQEDYAVDVSLMNAALLMEQGEEAESREIFERMVREYPAYDRILLLYGDSLRAGKRYKEAVALYSRVWQKMEQEGKPVGEEAASLLFALGVCYERTGDWERAERYLQRSLKLEPKQADVLNYLAYGWLERDVHIPEARKMIEEAVSYQEESSPQITDSLGWALYKMQEYRKAAEMLEEAVSAMPQDAVMNDHLGDVYWKLGRHNEARFQWRRAEKYNEEGELSAEKIQEKLERGL